MDQADGRKRIYYNLTAKGRRRLNTLLGEWERLSSGIRFVFGEASHA